MRYLVDEIDHGHRHHIAEFENFRETEEFANILTERCFNNNKEFDIFDLAINKRFKIKKSLNKY